jgi:hypothetical protein
VQRVWYSIAFAVLGIASVIATIKVSKESATQSEKILSLTQRSVNATTGGDSFCWMDFLYQDSIARPTFLQHGDYPVYGVTAWVADTSAFRRLTLAGKQTNSFPRWTLPLGDIAVGTGFF